MQVDSIKKAVEKIAAAGGQVINGPHQVPGGQWIVQASLDLHGLTTERARTELGRFLGLARHSGIRCVRIVHGKGTRSPNNVAVIRNKVRLSLSRRDEVLAFCDAAAADGGAGAVIVLLKSS